MGAVQSAGVQCLQSPEVTKRVALLEEQCSALAAENERLRGKLREFEEVDTGWEEAGARGGVGDF